MCVLPSHSHLSRCCTSGPAGDLIFHVGWTGPWLDHFLEDMHALLDSFLATQDLGRSTLLFWLMDREPDRNDALIKHYTALSRGKIIFRYADTAAMAEVAQLLVLGRLAWQTVAWACPCLNDPPLPPCRR